MWRVVCWSCGLDGPMESTLDRVRAGDPDPHCEECGGILKSATISFGQSLDPAVLARAEDAAPGLRSAAGRGLQSQRLPGSRSGAPGLSQRGGRGGGQRPTHALRRPGRGGGAGPRSARSCLPYPAPPAGLRPRTAGRRRRPGSGMGAALGRRCRRWGRRGAARGPAWGGGEGSGRRRWGRVAGSGLPTSGRDGRLPRGAGGIAAAPSRPPTAPANPGRRRRWHPIRWARRTRGAGGLDRHGCGRTTPPILLPPPPGAGAWWRRRCQSASTAPARRGPVNRRGRSWLCRAGVPIHVGLAVAEGDHQNGCQELGPGDPVGPARPGRRPSTRTERSVLAFQHQEAPSPACGLRTGPAALALAGGRRPRVAPAPPGSAGTCGAGGWPRRAARLSAWPPSHGRRGPGVTPALSRPGTVIFCHGDFS